MAKGEQKANRAQLPMDVRDILIEHIDIGEQMLRHDPNDDDVIELAQDVAAHGLMQPVGVYATEDSRYQLLWGSRRLAAFLRLNRRLIPARLCPHATTEEILSQAIRENLMRRQLTLKEEIHALRRLVAEGKSTSEISSLVGKTRDWVNRRLAFDQMPLEIRDHVLEGQLPLGHAEALALITDPGALAYLLQHALQHRPSLVSLRASIEALTSTPTFGEAVEAGTLAAQQTQPTQELHISCASCRIPSPLHQLIILRLCPTCAHVIVNTEHTTDAPTTQSSTH